MTQNEIAKLARELAREVVRESEATPPNAAINAAIRRQNDLVSPEEVDLVRSLVARDKARNKGF